MAEVQGWARVQTNARSNLRRGAWYQVLRLTVDEAVLEVDHQPCRVARPALQITPQRPRQWSVVPRPRDAVNLPLSWGTKYGVCPGCSHRAALGDESTPMRCPRCNGVFAVAWDEPYLVAD